MDEDPALLTYTGGWLDRAAGRRSDRAWLAATLKAPDARLIALWRDRCLVIGDPPVPVRLPADAATLAVTGDPVFLGLDGAAGVFAVDLSALPEEQAVRLCGADRTADVRAVVGNLDPAEAATQAYARGLLHWHRNQAHCGKCGGRTASRDAGHARACQALHCGRLLFPRIEPAVIVLIEAPGDPARCLLVRHRGAAENAFALIAGFLEIGESLEDAVRREAAEEAGVVLSAVHYLASQAWPFPAGVMVGFHATATSDTFDVDGDELIGARWFTRAQLRERAAAGHDLGRVDAIDRLLIRSWLERGD